MWKKVLPNSMFGDFNPYLKRVEGDWLFDPQDYSVHLGDVYINGKSMFEATSKKDLYEAKIRYTGCKCTIDFIDETIKNPADTVYRWYAEVTDEETTLYCNFQSLDPNSEVIEINVRKCCFYPTETGRNYITVRGFEMAHAACPFTPPTADQIGMLGANWSCGWIIENNHLHDAKCSAISIGKEASTGDNEGYKYHRKHSHYYQTEAVFLGLQKGWEKGRVGSHLIRNNLIHDCGQNGIVGHMGCAFSRVEHNHIYNIAAKREFHGAEIAGIKFHTAIDVVIENNNVHDCTRGIWLDWQAQGARITKNLLYNNAKSDIMLEVTHGPCLIDNNLILSSEAFENLAQGTAYVHNIIAGNMRQREVLNRTTPYHFPHSTQVRGITKTFGGDDRVINNIILGKYVSNDKDFVAMCSVYDKYYTPEAYYDYMKKGRELDNLQPVWIEGNAYAGYASAFRAEGDFVRVDRMSVALEEKEGEWILTLDVPESLCNFSCSAVTTERLGTPIFTEQRYETPEGESIDFTLDICGAVRQHGPVIAGPLASLTKGKQSIAVWKN